MAKENFESIDEEMAFRAQLGSKGQKLTKVALGLLTLAFALLVVGWYWPLHRAHAVLRSEYAKASKVSAELRSKLERTIKVLESTTKERDVLEQAKEARERLEKERLKQIDALSDEVEDRLKPFAAKGWLKIEKSNAELTVTFRSRVLQKGKQIDLTRAGDTAVCKALEPLKTPKKIHLRLEGLGTNAQAADRALKPYESGLEVGAARAARAAATALRCGVSADKLTVIGRTATENAADDTLRMVFEADAATAPTPPSQGEPKP